MTDHGFAPGGAKPAKGVATTMGNEKKDDKKQLIDYPDYQPDKRVPFPPSEEGEYVEGKLNRHTPREEKKDYYKNYDPDPQTPQPAATTPGAPNLHDPDTRLTGEETEKLSASADLDDNYKNP